MRLLFDFVPLVLVELRGVSWPGGAITVVQVDSGFARRAHGGEKETVRERYGVIPVPHNSQLLEDLSQGTKPRQGDCGDQEEHGICMTAQFINFVAMTPQDGASGRMVSYGVYSITCVSKRSCISNVAFGHSPPMRSRVLQVNNAGKPWGTGSALKV